MLKLMADSGVNVSLDNAAGPESGVARSYKFWATNSALKQSVALLTAADKWIYEMYKLFTGDSSTWAAYTEYPTEFAPTAQLPVNEMIDLIKFYKEENLPQNVIDAQIRLRALIDPMASREDSQSLIDEITERYENGITANGDGAEGETDGEEEAAA